MNNDNYADYSLREMTTEVPPDHDDACMVCDKIECVCPPEDVKPFTPSEFRDRIVLQLMPPRRDQ